MDPVSALIVDEAPRDSPIVLVLDDEAGALGAAALGFPGVTEVRGWCDSITDQESQAEGVRRLSRLDPTAFEGVDLVLLRLPKALGALDEFAELIARHAAPGVRVVAGGRDKHMGKGMNETLAAHFADVRASLGRQKSRVLHASGPKSHAPIPAGADASWPRSQTHEDLGLTLFAHGSVFAGTKVDAGTSLLLAGMAQGLGTGDGRPAIDAGSGNGVIAAWLARAGFDVLGVDISALACDSTARTAAANGVQVQVLQADGLEGLPDFSAEVIVTNPPFHIGTTKDSTPGLALVAQAGRVLRPRGEFWCVFNSHLPYLPALREHIGSTEIVKRDREYTVTRSRRRAA